MTYEELRSLRMDDLKVGDVVRMSEGCGRCCDHGTNRY